MPQLASYFVTVQEDAEGVFSATWTPGVNGNGTMVRIEQATDPIRALRNLATALRVEDDRKAMINAIDNTDDD